MTSLHPAPRYRYYDGSPPAPERRVRARRMATALGDRRLHPQLSDPDYLLLRARRANCAAAFAALPEREVDVLDLGGRIQPYRALLESRCRSYISLDPQSEGLVSVVGVGEALPFRDAIFDLVICTQVLSYADSPRRLVDQIHRVLRPGGMALITAPALFPAHHDERWRYLPEGLRLLLRDFADVRIVPEGGSVAGAMRTVNVMLMLWAGDRVWLRRGLRRTLIPLCNLIGSAFDRGRGGALTANLTAIATR